MIDPFGGIWTLWPLFGASNQMLAAIALILCTVILFKMKRERFAWVTLVPAAWLVVCTVTAGIEKVAHPDPKVGFVAHARLFGDAAASGKVLAPAKTLDEMGRIVFNDYVDATLAAIFVAIVLVMLVYGDPRGAAGASTAEGDDGRDRRRGGGGGMSRDLANAGALRLRHGRPDGAPHGRRSRLSDLCRAPEGQPSRTSR